MLQRRCLVGLVISDQVLGVCTQNKAIRIIVQKLLLWLCKAFGFQDSELNMQVSHPRAQLHPFAIYPAVKDIYAQNFAES